MLRRIKAVFTNQYSFSVVAKVFGVLVGFIFTIFQARYLGTEIKGQVATVNSIVSVTSILFGLGINNAYPYYKRNSDKDILPVFMKIALLMLLVYCAISAITIALFQIPAKYIAVMIITPLWTYDKVVSYITLIEVPNRRHMTDMGVALLELILLIVLWIVAPPTFVIGVIIIAVKDVIKAFLFTLWWRKRIFEKSESLRKWFPILVKFGFFPMLSLLMTTLNYRLDVWMLNGYVSDSLIGVYSVGVMLAERIWMIPEAMKGVMVSKITKGKDAREVAYVTRICNTICLLIVVGIIALGKPFISFIFGAAYEGAYLVTLILMGGIFPMIYYKLIGSYNIAIGKQRISFLLLTISVVCNVVANLLLIPAMGIYGAGLASVISYTVCSVLFIVYFCRTTKISFFSMLFVNKSDLKKLKKKLGKDGQKKTKEEKSVENAAEETVEAVSEAAGKQASDKSEEDVVPVITDEDEF